MKPSAPYRRRCSACGASALQVASRCPACGEAMQTRDARGERLVLWGCRGCHTLNTPSDAACQHCAAPRGRSGSPRRAILAVAAVAAVAMIAVVGAKQWPAAPTTAESSVPPAAIVAEAAPPSAAIAMTAAPEPDPAPIVVTPPTATIAVRDVEPSAVPPTEITPSTQLISVKWVNVRTGPTPSADILGVIKPQTTVVVLASQDGWVRVKSDSLTGWVYGQGVAERE